MKEISTKRKNTKGRLVATALFYLTGHKNINTGNAKKLSKQVMHQNHEQNPVNLPENFTSALKINQTTFYVHS